MPDLGKTRASDVFEFGPFRLLVAKRLLTKDGEPLPIGGRALELLITLLERAGEVISHKELIASVWPDVTVDDANLRVHIGALRKALGDGRDGMRYLSNVAGRGYCFVAPTRRSSPVKETLSRVAASPLVMQSHRLPSRSERIVGRDETVLTLLAQLMMRRFVSIVGPGGVGKTAVALSVAHASVEGFSGAVFFVDLSSLTDPCLVATAVASSLGCTLHSHSHDPLISLLAFLGDQKLLLVLDGCETVVEAAAELTERVVREAPRAHVLATSREALGAGGEQVHILHSLESPPENSNQTAEEVLRYPATQLFMDRAVAAGYRGELADRDAAVVAKICRRLDGIALAIELAASRAGSHGIRGTAALLDNRFGLAWKGRRTALPRHQTLTSMLDWSYRLLSERERRVLCRLSVFVGEFTAEAAFLVAGDEDLTDDDIIDAVAGLLAKSLISTTSTGGARATYYRLLDITRAYALVKLEERGETDDVFRKHAISFCGLLQQDTTLQSGNAESDLSKFIPHLGNVRAALDWALSEGGDPAIGVELAASAVPLLIGLSSLDECRRYCEQALAVLHDENRGGRTELVLQEAMAYSSMFTKGNSGEVRAALERGLYLAEGFNDSTRQLNFLAGLNAFLYRTGDFRGALAIARRSSAVAQRANDGAGLVMAEWMLGVAHHCVGNQAAAERHCQDGMKRAVELAVFNPKFFGYDHRIRALVGLAGTLWLRGYASRALRTAQQAIDEAAAGDRPVSVCISLYTAQVFFRAGSVDRARELAERLIEYAARFALGPFHAVGTALKAELAIAGEEVETGVGLLRQALGDLHSERHNILFTVLSGALAEGLRKVGRSDEALMAVNGAIDQALSSGAALELSELLRLKAEVLAAGTQASRASAMDVLKEALHLAREQTALAYELRSATTLARLLSGEGYHDRARETLAPVYERFTEGFETPDLRVAQAVLKDLA
jgi:predicted ATPase/DNA-binding winged helix-turn-helix (wHTH) protein